MKNVLIVDDEKEFILSLIEGLGAYKDQFDVLAAENGKQAVEVLESKHIDLVVTDLKMPEMDGFELLEYLNANFHSMPVIVMTVFGTPEIEERLKATGTFKLLDKPISIEELEQCITKILDFTTKEGVVSGISVENFLQMIEMEQKTCLLEIIREDRKKGGFYFKEGALYDAFTGDLKGEEAAIEIIIWENVDIKFKKIPKKKFRRRINKEIMSLVMEAMKSKDEVSQADEMTEFEEDDDLKLSKEDLVLEEPDIDEKLNNFIDISGFMGVGSFTPTGESLGIVSGGKINMKEIGILASNALFNFQKVSLDMGTGRGQLLHVEAEKAHILVRCLNEGTDPLKTQPGKAHFHTVLVLSLDGQVGMGKMRLNKITEEMADDLR